MKIDFLKTFLEKTGRFVTDFDGIFGQTETGIYYSGGISRYVLDVATRLGR